MLNEFEADLNEFLLLLTDKIEIIGLENTIKNIIITKTLLLFN